MSTADGDEQRLAFRAREMGPDCPSELALERHRLGWNDPADRAALVAHIDGCLHCRRWMANASRGVDGLPDFNAIAALAAVRRSAPPPRWRWRWPMFGLAVAGIAAAAAIYVRPGPTTTGASSAVVEQSTTRLKGGLALYAWRSTPDGGAERLISGAAVAPGDRIRFGVDLPEDSQLRVLGVEPTGATYVAWPLDPSLSTHRPAGDGQALPGAAAIDDASGTERFYLVACPPEGPSPECGRPGRATAPPACPAECRVTPFVLEKPGR